MAANIDEVLAGIGAQSAWEFLSPLRRCFVAPGTSSSSSLVQIQGPPASGKTSLLLLACVEALVPHEMTLPFSRPLPGGGASSARGGTSNSRLEVREVRIHLDGQARRENPSSPTSSPSPPALVHIYDPLSRFPLPKLRHMLHRRLRDRIHSALNAPPHLLPVEIRSSGTLPWSPPDAAFLNAIVDGWLDDVAVWSPRSLNELRACLERCCALASSHGPALILIDSLSIFDAPLALELSLGQSTSTSISPRLSTANAVGGTLSLRLIAPLLARVTRLLKVQVVIVTHLSPTCLSDRPDDERMSKAPQDSDSGVDPPPMKLHPLEPGVSQRLTLLPSISLNVLPYPATTTLSAARADTLRDDAIAKRGTGINGWRETVLVKDGGAGRARTRFEGFELLIDEKGVKVI